jgi:hypothetical protein
MNMVMSPIVGHWKIRWVEEQKAVGAGSLRGAEVGRVGVDRAVHGAHDRRLPVPLLDDAVDVPDEGRRVGQRGHAGHRIGRTVGEFPDVGPAGPGATDDRALVRRGVEHHALGDGSHVGRAGHGLGGGAGLTQRRQEDGDQQRDDANDNKQLDEREGDRRGRRSTAGHAFS